MTTEQDTESQKTKYDRAKQVYDQTKAHLIAKTTSGGYASNQRKQSAQAAQLDELAWKYESFDPKRVAEIRKRNQKTAQTEREFDARRGRSL